MTYNRFIDKNGKEIINLANDTISKNSFALGEVAFDSTGKRIVGTNIQMHQSFVQSAAIPTTTLYPYQFANLQDISYLNTAYATNTSIPEGLCFNCQNLSTISFRSDTLSIGSSAFTSTKIGAINGINTTNYMSIGSSAFDMCKNLKTIPFTYFSYIGSNAFANTGITTLTINSYTGATIGNYAFGNCSDLKTANIVGLNALSSSLFYNCSNLSSVSLNADKITIFPSYVFAYCSSLSKLNTYHFPNCTTLSYGAFQNTLIASLSLPKANILDRYAFGYCYSLESVSLSSVTTIPYGLFYDCKKLKDLYFNGVKASCTSLKTIGNNAFYGCLKLPGTFYFSLLSSIGQNAFKSCYSLVQVITGSTGMTTSQKIGSSAFYDCTSLKAVSFPRLNYIYSYAFGNCTSLSYFIVPSTYTTVSLQNYIFSGCDYNKLVILCEREASSTTWSTYWNKTAGTSNFQTIYNYKKNWTNGYDLRLLDNNTGKSHTISYEMTSLYYKIPYSSMSLRCLSSYLNINSASTDIIRVNNIAKTFSAASITWAHYCEGYSPIEISGTIKSQVFITNAPTVSKPSNLVGLTTNYLTFIPERTGNYYFYTNLSRGLTFAYMSLCRFNRDSDIPAMINYASSNFSTVMQSTGIMTR